MAEITLVRTVGFPMVDVRTPVGQMEGSMLGGQMAVRSMAGCPMVANRTADPTVESSSRISPGGNSMDPNMEAPTQFSE
jgi:hypothetical protein